MSDEPTTNADAKPDEEPRRTSGPAEVRLVGQFLATPIFVWPSEVFCGQMDGTKIICLRAPGNGAVWMLPADVAIDLYCRLEEALQEFPEVMPPEDESPGGIE